MGGTRVSCPGGLLGCGRARSTRLGVARRAVVARGVGTDGGERYELAGGEVLRESDNNDDMGRFWANRRAGRGLRARASKMGASKRPKGRRNDANDELRGGASGRRTGSALRGSARATDARVGPLGTPGARCNARLYVKAPMATTPSSSAATRSGARRKLELSRASEQRRGWGVSTRRGECNGVEPVTKRSPEPCRRRAPQ